MKIFLLVLMIGLHSEAATVLIPQFHSNFETYRKQCRRQDFICSSDYFTAVLTAKPTPAFDDLMDELNLNDASSMDNFRNRVIHILNTEEISTTQLRMLLDVLNEMNQLQPSVYFKMIEQELRRLLHELQKAKPRTDEEFIFIFKQRLPLSQFTVLRTTILKIPLYILHYSSLPQKTNTRELSIKEKVPLVQNDRLTQPLTRTKWALLARVAAAAESKPELRAHRDIP